MPPRLRTVCSCRRSPSPAPRASPPAVQPYSSTSTPAHHPPEFLCPSFGFFSRALPRPSTLSSPTRRTAVAPTHWPILVGRAPERAAVAGTRRKGWLDPQTCDCGRGRGSCLRCRGVATSARTHVADESSTAPEDHSGENPDVEDKVEPPIPPARRVAGRASHPPQPLVRKSRLELLLDDIEERLPIAYTELERTWRRKAWEHPDALATLRKLEGVANQRAIAQLDEGRQLDLLRIYGRIARAPNQPDDAAPLVSAADLAKNELARAAASKLRHRAGAAMLTRFCELGFDDPERSPNHRTSKSSIRIDALGLLDQLPPVPTASRSLEPDQFAADLRAVFGRSSHLLSSDEEIARSSRVQLQTLGYLVQAWERAPDGPAQAATFLASPGIVEILNGMQYLEDRRNFPVGLRPAFTRLVSRLAPTPAEWITSSRPEHLDRALLRRSLVWILALGTQPLEAVKVYEHPDLSVDPRDDYELLCLTDLVVGLTRARLFVDAQALANRLEPIADRFVPSDPRERRVALEARRALARLAAAQGHTDQTYAFILRLQSLGWEGGLEPGSLMMRSRAQAHELAAVTEIFEATMATVAAASDRDRVRLWGQLISAHVRFNDVEGGLRAFNRLIATGLSPNVAILNSLLAGHSMRTDIDAAYALFNRFPEYGVAPNIVSYTALIALHARLRDPEAAMSIFRQCARDGIQADQPAWTTMMNLFVEAGHFSLATEIYRYLQVHPDPAMRPDSVSTNVILKATVAAGASVDATLTFFRAAIASGARPDLQSYTLVLQSLCIHGEMDAAEELVVEMGAQPGASLLPASRGMLDVDVHVVGILVHGYLNAGETAKARACLLDMRSRGIAESSVVYGLVVGSFLRANPLDGVAAATKLAREFLNDSPLEPQRRTRPPRSDLPLARGTAPLTVLFPLIQELCRSMKAFHALEYFRLVLRENVHPPIHLYTTLMDGYRRVADDESVGRIWKHLHDTVLEAFPAKDAPVSHATVDQYHREALCVPFSIFIDAYSDRGAFQPIVRMWRTLAAEGFVFDAGNWNRFGIASCRWNQVEQAFWIAEHVLLRPPDAGDVPLDLSTHARELGPLGQVGFSLSLRPRVPIRQVLKRERRVGDERWHYRRPSLASLLEARPDDELVGVEESIAHAQRVRASVYWFPHAAFLEALDLALRSGAGADSKVRKALIENHPRTMDAVRKWKAAKWKDKRAASGRT